VFSRQQTFLAICVGIVVVFGATRAAQKLSKGSFLRGSVTKSKTKESSSSSSETTVSVVAVPGGEANANANGGLTAGTAGGLAAGGVAAKAVEAPAGPAVTRYLTIIDAGSSGCRAHVFSYSQAGTKVEVNPAHKSYKVKPGLSSYADEPSKATESVEPLLDFIAGEIPEEQRGESPVFLKATAGLRLVEPSKRDAILDAVSAVFQASEYAFDRQDGAKVIAGTEEGGFGWMSVNFLLDTLDDGPVGVVEMGGASAQVTTLFAKSSSNGLLPSLDNIKDTTKTPNLRGDGASAASAASADSELPSDSSFDFDMNGEHFDLYAHSYLGYGLEKARETLTQYLTDAGAMGDPCINEGYAPNLQSMTVYDGTVAIPGRGNAADCRATIERALFPEPPGPCPYASCSQIQNAFQPPKLPKLLAFENFFYTQKMLGGSFDTPKGFDDKAADVCDKTFDELTLAGYPKDGSDTKDLVKLCFAAVYLPTFLEKGLKLNSDEHLKIQQDVGDFDIDWSLGAAIREANHLAAKNAK